MGSQSKHKAGKPIGKQKPKNLSARAERRYNERHGIKPKEAQKEEAQA